MVYRKYLEVTGYEDEYSRNEIDAYQTKFIEEAKEYLHKNCPGKYVVSGGLAVFVLTVEEAKKRKLLHVDELIVY